MLGLFLGLLEHHTHHLQRCPRELSAGHQPARLCLELFGVFLSITCIICGAGPMNNLQVTNLHGYGCLEFAWASPSSMNNLQVTSVYGCARGCLHHLQCCPHEQSAGHQLWTCLEFAWASPASMNNLQVTNLHGCACSCLRFACASSASFAALPP